MRFTVRSRYPFVCVVLGYRSGMPAQQPKVDRHALARKLGDAIGGYLPTSQRSVLGWLLVCDPAEQTQADLREQLGLSLGSVSAALSFLDQLGMLAKDTQPGSRTATYRLRDDAWASAVERSIGSFAEGIEVARRGAKELGEAGDTRARDNVTGVARYMEAAQTAVEQLLREIRQ